MFSIRMLVSKNTLLRYSSNIINNRNITKLPKYNKKYSIQSEKLKQPEQPTQSENVEDYSILSIPITLYGGIITFIYSICSAFSIYAGTYMIPLQFNSCNCRDCR